MAWVIFRIEESRPPGVSIVRSTATAPSSAANGSTTPSSRSETTWFPAAFAGPAANEIAAPMANSAPRARNPRMTPPSSHPRDLRWKPIRHIPDGLGRPLGPSTRRHGVRRSAYWIHDGPAHAVHVSKPNAPVAPYIPWGDVAMIFESAGPLTAHEEQALVRRLLCGDEEAVRTIYARFARPVYSLGLRLLGSAEAAEELTQDVFLRAWCKAGRFDATRGRL